MFDRYTLSACFDDADAVVSVAKMKNHAFMGITLCTKNLFGLPPMILPEGRTRSYYHHLIPALLCASRFGTHHETLPQYH